MKKDCALVLTFIGFLYLYVSLSFLVTRTLPVPPQTISLLTKCTNEMSPPTAGWEDWCARTFFHFIWIFFPCTFSSPHFHHWFFFFLSSISQHWKLNFWPSLFVTQTCCIGSKKYASTSTKYSIKPWGAPYCLNITRLRGAIYQKIRLITAFPHVVKYLLLYSLQFKSPNECRGHTAKHRVSCKKTTFLNNRKEAAEVASTTPKYSLWHLQFALQKSPQ